MAIFKEDCWIIYGHKWGKNLYGVLRYESEGEPSSVNFDWEKVSKNAKNIIGFCHTHPGGYLSPSPIDDITMAGWVKALGKPLICGIKVRNEIRIYVYERSRESVKGYRKVVMRQLSFKKIGHFLKIEME